MYQVYVPFGDLVYVPVLVVWISTAFQKTSQKLSLFAMALSE